MDLTMSTTRRGEVLCYDARNAGSAPLWRLEAHGKLLARGWKRIEVAERARLVVSLAILVCTTWDRLRGLLRWQF